MIRKLCILQNQLDTDSIPLYLDLNSIDYYGNTALKLAHNLGNLDAIRVLCDHGLNSKLKPLPFIDSPYELAIKQKNREILKIYVQSNQKLKQAYIDDNKKELFDVLETLPDFQIDMSFECESNFIPFLRSFAPHDIFKIYKQKSSIRLDFSNNSIKNQITNNSQRDKSNSKNFITQSSFLFKGRNDFNEGELLYAEHSIQEDGKIQSGYSINVLTDMYLNRIDQEIDKLLKKKEKAKLYEAVSFKLETQRDWKGQFLCKQIEGYQAVKMKANASFNITYQDIDDCIEISLLKQQKAQNFEAYFNLSKVDAGNLLGYIKSQQQKKPRNTSNKKKKTDNKDVKVEMWAVRDFPINIATLRPLFHIMGFASKNISKFNDFLFNQAQIPSEFFPIQAQIPLFMTIKANIQFGRFSFLSKQNQLPSSFFNIDEEILKIQKSREFLLNINQIVIEDINYDKLFKDLNIKAEIVNESSQNIDSRMVYNNYSITSEQGQQLFATMMNKQGDVTQTTFTEIISQDFSEKIHTDSVIRMDYRQQLSNQGMIKNFKTMKDINESKHNNQSRQYGSNQKPRQIKMSNITTQLVNQSMIQQQQSQKYNSEEKDTLKKKVVALVNTQLIRPSRIIEAENVMDSRNFTNQQIQAIKSIKLPQQKSLESLNSFLKSNTKPDNSNHLNKVYKNIKNIIRFNQKQAPVEYNTKATLGGLTAATEGNNFNTNQIKIYGSIQGLINSKNTVDNRSEDVSLTMIPSQSTIDMRDQHKVQQLQEEKNTNARKPVLDMRKYSSQENNHIGKKPFQMGKVSFQRDFKRSESSSFRENSKLNNTSFVKATSLQRNKKVIDADAGQFLIMNTWGNQQFQQFQTNSQGTNSLRQSPLIQHGFQKQSQQYSPVAINSKKNLNNLNFF
ncbi:UNKNOWN [Stylonychia lemnae]|uniref:Ankyrin repeat domain-containing protein n=1 Tax=Stylonychia lemnae TaxID=5949 RepID=A0A078AQD7_STYLE|nr:UNKNOWN [Stylonychia lemnae]|eukprot:CDW83158.1 UNKNOWN [Stylonychia lemnae]